MQSTLVGETKFHQSTPTTSTGGSLLSPPSGVNTNTKYPIPDSALYADDDVTSLFNSLLSEPIPLNNPIQLNLVQAIVILVWVQL